jgi:hypothetical protein
MFEMYLVSSSVTTNELLSLKEVIAWSTNVPVCQINSLTLCLNTDCSQTVITGNQVQLLANPTTVQDP